MLFLLINIFINIGYAQFPDVIDCNSAVEGTTTNEQGFAIYNFYLAENSFVEINTCGSDFDTVLILQDTSGNTIAQNDNGNNEKCGPMNAIIDAGVLQADSYNIIIIPGSGAPFGSYDLALGCSPDNTPTIPDANGIAVVSDCNFAKDGDTIQPLDVCSLQIQESTGRALSRKYVCNPENNGILMMNYESYDCSGTPFIMALPGQAKKYYYNCAGSNDACDLGTLYMDCPSYSGDAIYVIDECIGKRMFECYGSEFSLNTYYDDSCAAIRNISYAPNGEDGCTFVTECGSGNCDIQRLDDTCQDDLDCPNCMQCCPKRNVCEFPPDTAESVLQSINQMDELHGVNGVGINGMYEGYKDILLVGVVLFVLINNLFICYWCVCKRGNGSKVKYEM
eukprot:428028_1